MRSQIPKGKWSNSRVFEDVVVAADMKIPVSELWSWNEEDQAFLLAFYRVKSTMQSFEEHLHDREMTRNKKANKQGGNRKPRRKRR